MGTLIVKETRRYRLRRAAAFASLAVQGFFIWHEVGVLAT